MELSEHDLDRWNELAHRESDPRLTHALEAGAGDGKVVQQLSGGPELLTAYLRGPGTLFTHIEHALLTAALDARRLGHYAPLPAALLADAADGTLAPRHRSPDPAWANQALHALSTGARTDGTRIDIRNTLTALTALRTRSGTPATYEPADYLDQHTRTLRADQIGSASLWEALTTHTTEPDDLQRLSYSATEYDLKKQAVQLGRRAVLTGASHTPALLMRKIRGPLDPHHHAAHWIATHADLKDPYGVAMLLDALREAGASQAATVLLNRDPATHTDLTEPYGVSNLLRALRAAGADPAVESLATRAVTQADITDSLTVAWLLQALREAGASQAVTALLNRDPATHTDLTNPGNVEQLLRELQRVDADQAAERVANRAAVQADLTDPFDVARLLRALRKTGADQAVTALLNRDPATHTNLTRHLIWAVR
ncbi:hypothetical protein [Streptomyces sp. NPDC006551]|uniref:hypothetical protein n=1 Tax=Streptomyces sp. NPDC006551 TaxID=3157178 RepID=UPI0033A3F0AD